jgi:5'-nucleotidase/UDP-sugar diphosphatase
MSRHSNSQNQGNVQGYPEETAIDRRTFVGLSATAITAVVLAGWSIKDGSRAYAVPGSGTLGAGNVLTIVHTNDVHSYVDVLPYAKGLVESLEGDGKTVVLVSAGDDFAGTPFATMSAGQDVVTAMNMTGYDLFTIGNHEYNMKADDFKAIVDAVSFPVLACNVLPSTGAASPSIKAYELLDFAGTKIAFIGIAYDQPGAPDLITSIEAAKQAAESDGATVFIGISHLGLTDPDEQRRSTYVADVCPWFSLIIDGHSHTELATGEVRDNGVLVVQTGEYGNNIGVTELSIDATSVTGVVASLIKIKGNETTCGITPDAAVQGFIASVNERNDAYVNAVVFTLLAKLDGSRANVRTRETALGNMIADAMRAKTGTDIAFVSGASLRSDLGPGNVTRGQLETALLAETELAHIVITGAEVLNILEDGLSTYPEQYFLFPHISGIRVAFDAAKPAGARVVYAALANGMLINPTKTYSVTVRADIVSAYLSGADEYVEGVHYFTGYGLQSEAVIAFANSHTVATEPDGRLRLRGTSYTLRFNGNGADRGSMNPIELAYGEVIRIPECAFTRKDYYFVGWISDAGKAYQSGQEAVDIDIAANGEALLLAQWMKKGSGSQTQVGSALPATGDGYTLPVAASAAAAASLAALAVAAKLGAGE